MNKKYYIVIGILSVLLVIIISLISVKNLESKNDTNTNNQDKQKEQENEKKYTGKIRCEILDRDDEIYKSYFIDNLEIENDNVTTSETKHKIIYKNSENYKGFKENQKVSNPVYDDENLTIEYTFHEKYEVNDEMDIYIKNLTDNGYKCEKVTN